MLWWWPTFYGALACMTVMIAVLARSPDLVGAAVVLLASWAATNLSQAFVHGPYNQFYPAMDAVIAVTFTLAWRDRLEPWKIALILLVLAECLLHAAFFARSDWSFKAKYGYDLTLNLLYGAQLGCVFSASLVVILMRRGQVLGIGR